MDCKSKKNYIYENIGKVSNHNQFINLINQKECKYTQNNNGIFINLTTLSEEIINIMYQMLINLIDDKNILIKDVIKESNGIEVEFEEITIQKEEKTNKDVYLKDLTEVDKEIIIESKKKF